MIDCDYIVLYTFDQLQEVASFRTVALPRDMENYKNELEKQYLAKLLEKQKGQDNQENSSKSILFSYFAFNILFVCHLMKKRFNLLFFLLI